MLRKICDKCLTGEEIDWLEKPQRYIRPIDKKTIDLCKKCEDEFARLKAEQTSKEIEESCKLNENFLNN